ncbi:MbeB family mobilization protein [Actinobacillus pleuropneumoniae]|uniref:MbeB family mobilization protein n=1 Tax=Actinobacillus pleuropneumoniae TaxID=715 RepID=UPI003B02DB4F
MQNAIKRHEQNLIQQLQHAGNNLAENIQIEQAKLIKNTVKMYRLPTLIALTVLAFDSDNRRDFNVAGEERLSRDDRMAKLSRDSQRAERGDQAINLQNRQGGSNLV